MGDINWQQVETIIDQVLDLPEDQRGTFINEKCKGKPELKGEVTQLMKSIFDSEGWLENPEDYKSDIYKEMADDVQLLSSDQSLVGTEVGSYLIKEKIGEGGMGSVYLAEHLSDGINHKVAIKIIRSGKATQDNIRRFKREQQILAGLHHPGIARMYDVGATEDGFPYIIMEYVDGIPITDFCHKNDCTLDQKLELFSNVLQAVRYAHENLVIHRDLKPGNILVDESGNIKILDFGISKLLEDEDDPALTKTGARLLTPRYAAPEQVRQENITTATDLYALGIVFYLLLAGEHPFDFESLSQYEMEQTILNQEATKPSSKVSNSKLQRQLQGDLDAIALKAIRKEFEHRYRMANEFLEDLKNYQNGIPVSAVEDSFRYRSQKFLKRHKQGVVTIAGMLLLIAGLSGFYTWRIAQERDAAQLEAQKASEISSFLIDLFSASDPSEAQGDTIAVRTILNRGYDRISQLDDQPLLKSSLQHSMGKVFLNLGNYQQAENLLNQSLKLQEQYGETDAKKIATLHTDLGVLFHTKEELQKAKPHYLKSISLREQALGKNNLEYAQSLSDLGALMRLSGQLDSAKILHEQALAIRQNKLPENHPDLATSLNNMAVLYNNEGKLGKAESYLKQALEIRISHFGSVHPKVANTLNNLAVLYRAMGSFEQAENYYQRTLKIRKDLYGDDHPKVAQILNNYAGFLRVKGDLNLSEQLYSETLQLRKKIFGDAHIKTGTSYNNLANVYLEKERLDEAEANYRKAIDIYSHNLGEDHRYVAIVLSNLGNVMTQKGDYDLASKTLNRSYTILNSPNNEKTTSLANVIDYLGKLHVKQQDFEEAAQHFKTSLAIRLSLLGDNHPTVQENENTLLELYEQLRLNENADSLINYKREFLEL